MEPPALTCTFAPALTTWCSPLARLRMAGSLLKLSAPSRRLFGSGTWRITSSTRRTSLVAKKEVRLYVEHNKLRKFELELRRGVQPGLYELTPPAFPTTSVQHNC